MSLDVSIRESLPRLPSDGGLFPLGRAFTEKLCEDGEWALSENQRKLVCAPAVSVVGVSVDYPSSFSEYEGHPIFSRRESDAPSPCTRCSNVSRETFVMPTGAEPTKMKPPVLSETKTLSPSEEAFRELAKALFRPGDMEVLWAAGLIASQHGVVPSAQSVWHGVAPFCPETVFPKIALALAYMLRRMPDAAIRVLQNVKPSTPDEERTFNTVMGSVLHMAGYTGHAASLLASVVENDEASPDRQLVNWVLAGMPKSTPE